MATDQDLPIPQAGVSSPKDFAAFNQIPPDEQLIGGLTKVEADEQTQIGGNGVPGSGDEVSVGRLQMNVRSTTDAMQRWAGAGIIDDKFMNEFLSGDQSTKIKMMVENPGKIDKLALSEVHRREESESKRFPGRFAKISAWQSPQLTRKAITAITGSKDGWAAHINKVGEKQASADMLVEMADPNNGYPDSVRNRAQKLTPHLDNLLSDNPDTDILPPDLADEWQEVYGGESDNEKVVERQQLGVEMAMDEQIMESAQVQEDPESQIGVIEKVGAAIAYPGDRSRSMMAQMTYGRSDPGEIPELVSPHEMLGGLLGVSEERLDSLMRDDVIQWDDKKPFHENVLGGLVRVMSAEKLLQAEVGIELATDPLNLLGPAIKGLTEGGKFVGKLFQHLKDMTFSKSDKTLNARLNGIIEAGANGKTTTDATQQVIKDLPKFSDELKTMAEQAKSGKPIEQSVPLVQAPKEVQDAAEAFRDALVERLDPETFRAVKNAHPGAFGKDSNVADMDTFFKDIGKTYGRLGVSMTEAMKEVAIGRNVDPDEFIRVMRTTKNRVNKLMKRQGAAQAAYGKKKLSDTGVSSDVNDVIETLKADRKGLGIGETRPHAEVIAQARESMGKDYVDEFLKLGGDDILDDVQTVRLATATMNEQQKLQRMMAHHSIPANKSTQGYGHILKQMAIVGQLANRYKAVGSQGGRAQNIRDAQLVDGENVGRFMKDVSEAFEEGKINPETLIQGLMNLDATKQAKMLAMTNVPGWKDMYMEMYIGGLLSGTLSQARNVASTGMNVSLRLMDRSFASMFSKDVPSNDVPMFMRGIKENMGKIVEGTIQSFKTGQSTVDKSMNVADKLDLKHTKAITFDNVAANLEGKPFEFLANTFGLKQATRAVVGTTGVLSRLPFKALAGFDEMFRSTSVHGHYFSQLQIAGMKQAKSMKLSGAASAKHVEDFIQRGKNDPMGDDFIRLWERGLREGKAATFTENLHEIGQGIQAVKNGSPYVSLVLPFVKTPINIFKANIERTPGLNLFSRSMKESLKSHDPVTRGMAQARMKTSYGIAAGLIYAASEGAYTGPGPVDPRVKRQMTDNTGWQPMSKATEFNVEGDAIGFTKLDLLDPASMVMALSAATVDAYDHLNEEEYAEALHTLTMSVASMVEDKTFLQSIANTVKLWDSRKDPDKLKKQGGQLAATLVAPFGSALRRQVGQNSSSNVKELNTFMEHLSFSGFQGSTFDGDEFVVRHDHYGNEIQPLRGVRVEEQDSTLWTTLGNGMMPFRSSKSLATSDQLRFDQVLLNQGISIPPLVRKRVFKGEISNKSWNFFQKVTGELYAETVKRNGGFAFISSPEFLDMPESETATDQDGNTSQQGLISAWWTDSQKKAKLATYNEFPDTAQADASEILKAKSNRREGKGVNSQVNILGQKPGGQATNNKHLNALSTGG